MSAIAGTRADEALDCVRRLEEFDLFFLETPFMPELTDEYRRLVEATSIPIAGAEILTSYAEYGPLLEAGIDIAQAGTCRVGVPEWDLLARRAGALGRRFVPYGYVSTLFSVAANIQVAAANPNVPLVEHAPTAYYPHMLMRDVLAGPEPRIVDGAFELPTAPELGVGSTRTPSRATGSDDAAARARLGPPALHRPDAGVQRGLGADAPRDRARLGEPLADGVRRGALEEVADRYDLLMIDHPFCGTAETTGTLRPFDDLLDPHVLATLAADSIGPSHASYSFHGRQWGLATDAACQVAAVRDDLLDGTPAPVTWDEVRALARGAAWTGGVHARPRAGDLHVPQPVRERGLARRAGTRPSGRARGGARGLRPADRALPAGPTRGARLGAARCARDPRVERRARLRPARVRVRHLRARGPRAVPVPLPGHPVGGRGARGRDPRRCRACGHLRERAPGGGRGVRRVRERRGRPAHARRTGRRAAGVEAVATRMADTFPDVDDVGLIHADLHLGNALFHRGGVKLIDFDDCGTGHRLYELAVALWELRDRPDYSAFRDALLTGYREHRELDATHLDDFVATRQVAFDLWYTGMAQVNPAFAGRLELVHRWSLAMLDLVEK